MTPQDVTRRYLAAQAVAAEAGFLARRHFDRREMLTVELKGPHDWSSNADREVETAIVARLRAAFPDDGFLAEEKGGSPDRNLWVIDPIDGTANFLRGLPEWCVSIAFLADGVPEFGVIYSPVTKDLYAAVRGRGAALNGAAIRVSDCAELARATVGLGFSYRTGIEHHISHVRRLLERHCEYRLIESAALAMAYVADGRLDGFFEVHVKSWDVLAGLVLVSEAGGCTSDFLAGDGLTGGNPIFAAAPGIRDSLAAAVGFAVNSG